MPRNEYEDCLELVQTMCNTYFPDTERCQKCGRDNPKCKRRYDHTPLLQSLTLFNDILKTQRTGYYCKECGCGKFMRKPKPTIPSGWKRTRSPSPRKRSPLPKKRYPKRSQNVSPPKRSRSLERHKRSRSMEQHKRSQKEKRSRSESYHPVSPRYSPSSSSSSPSSPLHEID